MNGRTGLRPNNLVNDALFVVIATMNMNSHEFARAVGWHDNERKRVYHLGQAPQPQTAERCARLRQRFQEVTGVLWEKVFPNDLSLLRRRVILTKEVPEEHVIESLQKAGIAPQHPRTPLEEVLAREQDVAENGKSVRQALIDAMEKFLTERERIILGLRFLNGKSMSECAKRFNVSIERIRQIEAKALQKIHSNEAVGPLIDKCIECGFCEPKCPSRGLTLSPRQRIDSRRIR